MAARIAFDPAQESYASFAVAGHALMYRPSGIAGLSELTFMDRSGRGVEAVAPAALYYSPRLSHAGRQLAVDVSDPVNAAGDIWLFDLARRVSTRLTHDPVNESRPLWSPDDRDVFYHRNPDIYRRPASGTGEERVVLRSASYNESLDLSPDGRFSPDGRWVAYASDETGRSEVYVQGFDRSGDKVLVSRGGGLMPVWRADGKELFYAGPDDGRPRLGRRARTMNRP